MKYSVMYECRANGKEFQGNIEVERDFEPSTTDVEILDLARQDSARFIQSGGAGIEVISIKEIS
ncbi:hypothetical protein [Isoalcanivorax indicus]|uniref:hypothetical protein n=1 Tax=Isoalcanivorax indicus TaxID=2202653 RepID=UPI000DB9DBA9|nr:hypothetical protein [Isoalcanivorax indicus]